MNCNIPKYPYILFLCCLFIFAACKNKNRSKSPSFVTSPHEIQQKAPDIIHDFLESAADNQGKLDDSTPINQLAVAQTVYSRANFLPAWSRDEKWLPQGDSLFQLIQGAKYLGLFPEDYHNELLGNIRERFMRDSSSKSDRKDATLWSKADVLLTDAFLQIVKDVKLGRLGQDSLTLRKDSVLTDSFYVKAFDAVTIYGTLKKLISSLEPKEPGYQQLKLGIRRFLDSADDKVYTSVPMPGKNSAGFKPALQKRLFEAGFLPTDSVMADSAQLANGIKKFQQKIGIVVDGKAGEGTVRMLNLTDREKFVRIAISMDKYKMLPETMPDNFIWVNLPGYTLRLREGDSVKFSSKVICGKPLTRTPQLTSAISEMITYPQWTVPTSIIVKEILPAVKKNPGYLARKGFSLVDRKGDEVDPFTVDWKKYSKGIPYRVVQGSGDANALGIFKFNFNNKYAVYLHDTNQRYLFGNATRALSHGCVRVQEWQKLADYILERDYSNAPKTLEARTDSMQTWLKKKEKHSIPVRNRLPLFIRYFTCEGKNGSIVFYDDVYGEDKYLHEKFFAKK